VTPVGGALTPPERSRLSFLSAAALSRPAHIEDDAALVAVLGVLKAVLHAGPDAPGGEEAVVVKEVRERLTLSVEEAAEMLGISRTLAYELVRQGVLPHLRLARRIVISRRAIERMVDGDDRPA
jgi:excisionase family DNA binding protein